MNSTNATAVISLLLSSTVASGGGSVYISSPVWSKPIYGIVSFLGVIGNTLVIATISLNKHLHTATNAFLVSLAVADMFTSISLIPYRVLEFTKYISPPADAWGGFLCRVLYSEYPVWAMFFASVFNLLIITFERYYAIVHPFHYEANFTGKIIKILIAVAWLTGALSATYNIYTWYNDVDLGMCVFAWPHDSLRYLVGLGMVFGLFGLPTTAMVIAYWRIIVNLEQGMAHLKQNNDTENGPAMELKRAQGNVVRMLLTTVICFVVCWAPDVAIYFCFTIGLGLDFTSWYYHLAVCCALTNSCLNPFIYTLRSKQFRIGLMKLFGIRPQVDIERVTAHIVQ